MAKKRSGAKTSTATGGSGGASVPTSRSLRTATFAGPAREDARPTSKPAKPSALLDTRVVYCGDNLEQLVCVLKQTGSFCHKEIGEK